MRRSSYRLAQLPAPASRPSQSCAGYLDFKTPPFRLAPGAQRSCQLGCLLPGYVLPCCAQPTNTAMLCNDKGTFQICVLVSRRHGVVCCFTAEFWTHFPRVNALLPLLSLLHRACHGSLVRMEAPGGPIGARIGALQRHHRPPRREAVPGARDPMPPPRGPCPAPVPDGAVAV